jgi:hypothetical protein
MQIYREHSSLPNGTVFCVASELVKKKKALKKKPPISVGQCKLADPDFNKQVT